MKLEYTELNELWLNSTCVFLKVQVACVGFWPHVAFSLFWQTGGREMYVRYAHHALQMNYYHYISSDSDLVHNNSVLSQSSKTNVTLQCCGFSKCKGNKCLNLNWWWGISKETQKVCRAKSRWAGVSCLQPAVAVGICHLAVVLLLFLRNNQTKQFNCIVFL